MSATDQLVGCSSDKINSCHRRRSNNSLVHGKRWTFMRIAQEACNEFSMPGSSTQPSRCIWSLVGPRSLPRVIPSIFACFVGPWCHFQPSMLANDKSPFRMIRTYLYTLDATPAPRITIATQLPNCSIQTISCSRTQAYIYTWMYFSCHSDHPAFCDIFSSRLLLSTSPGKWYTSSPLNVTLLRSLLPSWAVRKGLCLEVLWAHRLWYGGPTG